MVELTIKRMCAPKWNPKDKQKQEILVGATEEKCSDLIEGLGVKVYELHHPKVLLRVYTD